MVGTATTRRIVLARWALPTKTRWLALPTKPWWWAQPTLHFLPRLRQNAGSLLPRQVPTADVPLAGAAVRLTDDIGNHVIREQHVSGGFPSHATAGVVSPANEFPLIAMSLVPFRTIPAAPLSTFCRFWLPSPMELSEKLLPVTVIRELAGPITQGVLLDDGERVGADGAAVRVAEVDPAGVSWAMTFGAERDPVAVAVEDDRGPLALLDHVAGDDRAVRVLDHDAVAQVVVEAVARHAEVEAVDAPERVAVLLELVGRDHDVVAPDPDSGRPPCCT